jgi:hypothetical protein
MTKGRKKCQAVYSGATAMAMPAERRIDVVVYIVGRSLRRRRRR